MKNVNIAHHPFRGDFTVLLNESADTKLAEIYFKIVNKRIHVTGGLVKISARGIRIQRLGQGVFFPPSHIKSIKVGRKKIWPENKFLTMLKNFFLRIFGKRQSN